MRVLHVAAGNLYGGVERILEEIAAARRGHEFALAFPGRLADALDAAGATRHDLGPVRFSRPWSVWRARRRLSRIIDTGAIDVVIAHAPWTFSLAAPALRGARGVLWAHDAMPGTHWTERRTAASPPSLVICNSRYTESVLAPWLSGSRRDVLYAPVAPPPPAAVEDRRRIRQELGAADDETVIVIAARFERWKGHQALIEALGPIEGAWRLWVAGAAQRPHEARYVAELHAAVARGGLTRRVHFLGERRDVPRILAGADLLCQPNTAPEPFGLSFVEALHAGLPVVTTNFGGASEIVTDACGVLVAPGDPAALSRELSRLVADAGARARLGAAGPRRARDLCDPARQIAALERLLA